MKIIGLNKRLVGFCLGLCWMAAVHAQAGFEMQGNERPSGDPRKRAKIHTELGAIYFQNGNMAVALEELRIALEADSTYVAAYSVRGLVHGYLKEFAKADEDFRRALSLAPNDPQVNNNYGWYLCETGKERQSIAYFLAALKDPLYDTPDRAYANAGTCALKAGDLEGAENYLLQSLRLSRDGAPQARLQLARLYYQRGLVDESRRYLNEAMKMIEPATAEALWLGVRLERKLGNRMAEGSYAAQLRGRFPTSPEYQEFLKGNFE